MLDPNLLEVTEQLHALGALEEIEGAEPAIELDVEEVSKVHTIGG